MANRRLLKHLVYLMFFIFIANTLALKFYWYSFVWYFDIIMHFLGGFWVGMFFLYVLGRKEILSVNSSLIIKVLFAVFIIGIVWEFYEFYIYQYISEIPFNPLDTVSDIFLDIFGGILSIFYFLKIIMTLSLNRVQLDNE